MHHQLSSENLVVFESALFRTTSTCIRTEEYLLLVDPNWLPAEVDYLRRFAGLHGDVKELFLLFTHSDYDHIIGYGAFPGFSTIASQRFVDNPDRNAQLQQAIDWDDEYYIRRDYAPLTYPVIDLPVGGDGQEMQIGRDNYVFYQAPGHNYDGLLTFNRSRGILVVGDYLSNVEFPYVYHSFSAYRATLATLAKLIASGDVKVLVTGHGDHTTDAAEMARRIADSYAYLDALDTSVANGTEFDFDGLMRRYEFPGIMRKFHDKNVALRTTLPPAAANGHRAL